MTGGGVESHGRDSHHWSDLYQEFVSMAVKALRVCRDPVELCSPLFPWLRAMLERKDTAWDKESSHRSHNESVRTLRTTNAQYKYMWLQLHLSCIMYTSYVSLQQLKEMHT